MYNEKEKAFYDYVAEVHNDLMRRGMISRPNDSMIGKEYLNRIYVRVSCIFPCTEGEIATAISDLFYDERLLMEPARKRPLYTDEDRAMNKYAEEVYEQLKELDKIENSIDTIAGTECFHRVYARVRSKFPRTENEVACALMADRKAGRCHAPDAKRRNATPNNGISQGLLVKFADN